MRDKSYNHTPDTRVNAPKPGESAHSSVSNSESANASPNANQPARYPSRDHKPPIRLGYDE